MTIGWKATAGSILIHALILTFVWVGFSVPLPRGSVGFYYTGSSLPPEEVRASATTDRVVDQAAADPYSAAFFNSWIGIQLTSAGVVNIRKRTSGSSVSNIFSTTWSVAPLTSIMISVSGSTLLFYLGQPNLSLVYTDSGDNQNLLSPRMGFNLAASGDRFLDVLLSI